MSERLFKTPTEAALEREVAVLKRQLRRYEAGRPAVQMCGEPVNMMETKGVTMLRAATWGVKVSDDDPCLYHMLGRVLKPNAEGLCLTYDYYLNRQTLCKEDQAVILGELHRVMIESIAGKL